MPTWLSGGPPLSRVPEVLNLLLPLLILGLPLAPAVLQIPLVPRIFGGLLRPADLAVAAPPGAERRLARFRTRLGVGPATAAALSALVAPGDVFIPPVIFFHVSIPHDLRITCRGITVRVTMSSKVLQQLLSLAVPCAASRPARNIACSAGAHKDVVWFHHIVQRSGRFTCENMS